MNKKSPAGLYIHVPFCAQKCRYCDFYSFPKGEEYFEIYKNRVIEAIEFYGKKYARPYNSLYFGGGTPLLLGEKHLCEIMEAAKPYLTKDAEVTAEGNPGVSERIDFSALKAAGINRLSFGLQSSNERELSALGRIHSPKEAAEKIAHDFGISYDNQLDEYKPSKDSVIAKIRREQENAKKNHTFRVLCDYLHLLKDWRTEYAPKSSEEKPNPLFVKALTETDHIDNLLDCFISGNNEDVADLIKDKSGRIADIEKTVRKFNKHSAELVM